MLECVCVLCVVNRQRIDSNTREQHDDTTDVKEGSVTHLKATGLRESLFQLWFSIQSQKNISKIWKSGRVRLWSRNVEVERGGPFQLQVYGLISLSTLSSFHTTMREVTRVHHAGRCRHVLQSLYCILARYISTAYCRFTHYICLVGGLLDNCVYT